MVNYSYHITTILIAAIHISQGKAFSSLGLASKFLSHHYLPHYVSNVPSGDGYTPPYGRENPDVGSSQGFIEEPSMKWSIPSVSNIRYTSGSY